MRGQRSKVNGERQNLISWLCHLDLRKWLCPSSKVPIRAAPSADRESLVINEGISPETIASLIGRAKPLPQVQKA